MWKYEYGEDLEIDAIIDQYIGGTWEYAPRECLKALKAAGLSKPEAHAVLRAADVRFQRRKGLRRFPDQDERFQRLGYQFWRCGDIPHDYRPLSRPVGFDSRVRPSPAAVVIAIAHAAVDLVAPEYEYQRNEAPAVITRYRRQLRATEGKADPITDDWRLPVP
jgi:hypothetical protein